MVFQFDAFSKTYYFDSRLDFTIAAVIYLEIDNEDQFEGYLADYNIPFNT